MCAAAGAEFGVGEEALFSRAGGGERSCGDATGSGSMEDADLTVWPRCTQLPQHPHHNRTQHTGELDADGNDTTPGVITLHSARWILWTSLEPFGAFTLHTTLTSHEHVGGVTVRVVRRTATRRTSAAARLLPSSHPTRTQVLAATGITTLFERHIHICVR